MKKETQKEIETEVTENELDELNDTDFINLEPEEGELIETEVTSKVVKKEKFLNPFEQGVTYAEFQEALGKKSVAEYCKRKLSPDQIDWIEKELSIINKK